MSKIELRDLLNQKIASNTNVPDAGIPSPTKTATPRDVQRRALLPQGPVRMNRALRPRRRS